MENPNPPQIGVTRAVITRLFAVAQYEHLKVELTVEISSDQLPGNVIKNALAAVEALNPKCPIEKYSLNRARAVVQASEGQPIDVVADAKELMTRFEVWEHQRLLAFEVLNDLGGQYEHIDKTPQDHGDY